MGSNILRLKRIFFIGKELEKISTSLEKEGISALYLFTKEGLDLQVPKVFRNAPSIEMLPGLNHHWSVPSKIIKYEEGKIGDDGLNHKDSYSSMMLISGEGVPILIHYSRNEGYFFTLESERMYPYLFRGGVISGKKDISSYLVDIGISKDGLIKEIEKGVANYKAAKKEYDKLFNSLEYQASKKRIE